MDDDEEFNVASYSQAEKERKAVMEAKRAAEADPQYRAILERTRMAQEDTVESSDNAVRTLRETRKVSESTKVELTRQGEQIRDVKGSAERADENVEEAYKNTRKIDKLSHFIPFFRSSNAKKRHEDRAFHKEQKALTKESERKERDIAARDDEFVEGGGSAANGPGPRRHYTDANEERIDQNLDEIGTHLQALKTDAVGMQTELSRQDTDLKEVKIRTEHTQHVMDISDKKLQRHL
jgi:hypothetical protein